MSNELDIALLRSLADRIELLERKVNEQKTMTFHGAHEPKTYSPGAVVQKAGGTYVAMTATSEAPGSSDHWRRLGVGVK